MFRILPLFLLMFTVGCERGPGETCNNADQCAVGGTCLKGVCAGYDCGSDLDCGEQTCGKVAGSRVCVDVCESDAECDGEQSCTEVNLELDDTRGTAMVCL